MSRLRPLPPATSPATAPALRRPPRPAAGGDEPIARAVRNLLWARALAAGPVGPSPRSEPRRPTSMRASLSFWTATAATADELAPAAIVERQELEVLGWERATRRVYLVERAGARTTLFVIATTGEHAGATLPLSGDLERVARLRATLTPLVASPARSWELTTRVVQRRGLRLASMARPVRKFALGVTVCQRIGGVPVAGGRATVTAYLRPRVVLDRVWQVPGENVAVAVVTYCGVPAGVGLDRRAAILATPTLQ